MRRQVGGAAWALAVWLSARRAARADGDAHRRLDFRTQTRGMGLRLTEWLRDRMRPGWLRVRRDDAAEE